MMALKMDMDLTVYYGLYKKDLEYFKGEYIDLPFIIGMLEDVWGEKIKEDKVVFEVTYADYQKYEGTYTLEEMKELEKEIYE